MNRLLTLSHLAVVILILIAASHHAANAQTQFRNVRAIIQKQPNGGRANQTLRFPPTVEIQEIPRYSPFKCSMIVTAQLYIPKLYNPTPPLPQITEGVSKTSDTGQIEFTDMVIDHLGSYLHIIFSVVATIDGENRSWTLMSNSFHVGAPDPTLAPPPTQNTTPTGPPPPPPPPATPRPTDDSGSAGVNTATPAPPSCNGNNVAVRHNKLKPPASTCVPFATQPTFNLIDANSGAECLGVPAVAEAALCGFPAGGESVTLNGTTTIMGAGSLNYEDLMICTAGSGWTICYNVTIGQQTHSFADTINIADGPTPAPPTTATPAVVTPSLDDAKAVIEVQPMWGISGLKLRQQPVIRISDRWNNIIKTPGNASAYIYLSSYLASSGATLIGTTDITTTDGVFRWEDIGVSTFGYGYYIRFVVDGGPGKRTWTLYSRPIWVQKQGASSVVEGSEATLDGSNDGSGSGAQTSSGGEKADRSDSGKTHLWMGLSILGGTVILGLLIAVTVLLHRDRTREKLIDELKQEVAEQQQQQSPSHQPTTFALADSTPAKPLPPTSMVVSMEEEADGTEATTTAPTSEGGEPRSNPVRRLAKTRRGTEGAAQPY